MRALGSWRYEASFPGEIFTIGVVRKTYNFVAGLIGLAVLWAIAFLFLVAKWQDYQEREYTEERQELVESVARELRERGLSDVDQLRQGYLTRCLDSRLTVFEGDPGQIRVAMADVSETC